MNNQHSNQQNKGHIVNNNLMSINSVIPQQISQIDDFSDTSQHSYRLGSFMNQQNNHSNNQNLHGNHNHTNYNNYNHHQNRNFSNFNPKNNSPNDQQLNVMKNQTIIQNQQTNQKKIKNRNTSFANNNFLQVNSNYQTFDINQHQNFQNRHKNDHQNIYKINVSPPDIRLSNHNKGYMERERQKCRIVPGSSNQFCQKFGQSGSSKGDLSQKYIQGEQNNYNNYQNYHDINSNPVITPQQFPLQEHITGYEIYANNPLSQQQILQAFKVIDVNKDNFISQEDIAFFLEYLKQPFTHQEVKQMINLAVQDFNKDYNTKQNNIKNGYSQYGNNYNSSYLGSNKKVSFDDFKRISKGAIIPLGHYKAPDLKWKNKQKIYQNIKQSDLYNIDNPNNLIKAAKVQKQISMKDFQETKKLNQKIPIQKPKNVDQFKQIQQILKLKDQKQFKARSQQFLKLCTINIRQALDNYSQNYANKMINNHQIRGMLQIDDKIAAKMYGTSLINSKFVIMEAIAFSRQNKYLKLSLSLNILTNKKTTNIQQLNHIIQFLKGKDNGIIKMLKFVFRQKNCKLDSEIDKEEILEMFRSLGEDFKF